MTMLGRLLIRPTPFNRFVHRVLHRKRDTACLVCTAVWRYLEADPAFVESIRQGEVDFKAGRTVRYHVSCNVDHGGAPCSWDAP